MLFAATTLQAQQLPDPHFEDWSDSFNGDAQPKYWHGSNVEQVGFKFTFLYQKDGRSGKCAYVADKEVGALGITEIGPGYFGLGTSWQKLEGINTGTATAGTYGGISFKYRPDSMVVWIKRTGDNTGSEDFHLLYYSWTGTAKGTAYKNKNDIKELIFEKAEKGTSFVVISSELEEIMSLCDRIIVIYEGRLVGEVMKADFSKESLMKGIVSQEEKDAE